LDHGNLTSLFKDKDKGLRYRVLSAYFEQTKFEVETVGNIIEIYDFRNLLNHVSSKNLVNPARGAHRLADLICEVFEAVTIFRIPLDFMVQVFTWRTMAGSLLVSEDL